MKISKDIINILLYGFIISFIIGIFLKNILGALLFGFFFTLLFYLPGMVWINKIKSINTFEKVTYSFLLGIALIPIIYIITGFFVNMNTFIFLLVPILVILTGIYFSKDKNQKESKSNSDTFLKEPESPKNDGDKENSRSQEI